MANAMAKERDREEDVLALVNALALLFISLPVSASQCSHRCWLC